MLLPLDYASNEIVSCMPKLNSLLITFLYFQHLQQSEYTDGHSVPERQQRLDGEPASEQEAGSVNENEDGLEKLDPPMKKPVFIMNGATFSRLNGSFNCLARRYFVDAGTGGWW